MVTISFSQILTLPDFVRDTNRHLASHDNFECRSSSSSTVLLFLKKQRQQQQTSTLKLKPTLMLTLTLTLRLKPKPAFEPEPKLVVDRNTRERASKKHALVRAENITTKFWVLTDEDQLNPGTILVSLGSSHC